MLFHNQFQVQPGVYVFDDITIIVSDIITHKMIDGVEREQDDPDVVFRVDPVNIKTHKRHSMPLSEFKSKFKKA